MDDLKGTTLQKDGEQEQEMLEEEFPSILLDKSVQNAAQVPKSKDSFCIGDFTINSLLFTGTEVVHLPPPKNAASEKEQQDIKGLFGLFSQLNFKMDAIAKWRSTENAAICEAFHWLEMGDYVRAKGILKAHTNKEPEINSILVKMIIEILKEKKHELTECMIQIKDKMVKAEQVFNNLITNLMNKTDENTRLREMLKTQHEGHTNQMATVVEESNRIKSGLINLLEEFDSGKVIESKLEEDLVRDLRRLLSQKQNELKTENEKKTEYKKELDEYKKREKDIEVVSLRSKLIASQKMCKDLEDQNMQFSGAVHKLSEKNLKLKNDLSLFNEELKKRMKDSERKNETILRQRTLIKLFQDKLGGVCISSVEELRERRERINRKMRVERDFLKRDALRKEMAECDRRLSDFIRMQEREQDRT